MRGTPTPWLARMIRAACVLAERHDTAGLLGLHLTRFAPRRKPSSILALAQWLKLVHRLGPA